jgi:hypothetical protein
MEPANPHDRITTHTPSRTQDNSPAKRTTARRSCENVQARGNIERSRARTAWRVCKQHTLWETKKRGGKLPTIASATAIGHHAMLGSCRGDDRTKVGISRDPHAHAACKSPLGNAQEWGSVPMPSPRPQAQGASRHARALPTGRPHKRGCLPRSHPPRRVQKSPRQRPRMELSPQELGRPS